MLPLSFFAAPFLFDYSIVFLSPSGSHRNGYISRDFIHLLQKKESTTTEKTREKRAAPSALLLSYIRDKQNSKTSLSNMTRCKKKNIRVVVLYLYQIYCYRTFHFFYLFSSSPKRMRKKEEEAKKKRRKKRRIRRRAVAFLFQFSLSLHISFLFNPIIYIHSVNNKRIRKARNE